MLHYCYHVDYRISPVIPVIPSVPRVATSAQPGCHEQGLGPFPLSSFLPFRWQGRSPYIPSFPSRPQGRLKSLHSVYRKMVRKDVPVAQVRCAGLGRAPEPSNSATYEEKIWLMGCLAHRPVQCVTSCDKRGHTITDHAICAGGQSSLHSSVFTDISRSVPYNSAPCRAARV